MTLAKAEAKAKPDIQNSRHLPSSLTIVIIGL